MHTIKMADQDWTPLIFLKRQNPPNNISDIGVKKHRNSDSDVPYNEILDTATLVGKDIGLSLYKARKDRNLTQELVAKQLNMQISVIKDYESGIAHLDKKILRQICQLLGIKP